MAQTSLAFMYTHELSIKWKNNTLRKHVTMVRMSTTKILKTGRQWIQVNPKYFSFTLCDI